MRIRSVILKDFESIHPLLDQLWDGDVHAKKAKNIFLELLKDPHVYLVVMSTGNKIIGFASMRWKYDLWTQGKVAHLDEIIIDDSCRGKGIGKKLLNHLEKKAKQLKCNVIICESALKRKKTHRFYTKLDWTKYGYAFYKFFRKDKS